MENNEQQVESTPSQDFNPWEDNQVTTPVQEVINTPEVVEETPVVEAKEEVIAPVVEPVITEKIVEVEKIVEKMPEFKDDYSKQLFDAIREGKEDLLYDYLSKKNRNYNTMADSDVIREKMKLDNPTWTDEDVDVEMDYKFGDIAELKDLDAIDKEIDPDEYQKAVEFNRSVRQKELLRTREARDARQALNESKKTIEFPNIQQESKVEETPLTQDQIDELNRAWEEKVSSAIPNLSDFTFKVGDEEVSYKITDEDKASQLEYMKDFNGQKVFTDLGWIDKDGNENVLKIAEDLLKLKNFERIVSSSASQMKTTAKKEVIADIKNIDLNKTTTKHEIAPDLGAQLWSN